MKKISENQREVVANEKIEKRVRKLLKIIFAKKKRALSKEVRMILMLKLLMMESGKTEMFSKTISI